MIAALLIVFLLGLVLGFPIIVVMLLSAVAPSWVNPSFAGNMTIILRACFTGVDSVPLLAMPLFVLSGDIMTKGGISRKLFDIFSLIVGRMTGGLPCAVILTCLFYGAISGSATATCVAVGSMTIPILLEAGYEKKFCCALVATASGLGIIIPPSTPMIVFGSVTGTSIGRLFKAGVLPGCLLAAFLMAYSIWYCHTHGEDKDKIRSNYEALRARGVGSVFVSSIGALMCPVIILGGIYSGIITPSEAATVSIFYALLVSLFFYRSIRVKDIPDILVGSVHSAAPTLFIMAVAGATGRIMAFLNLTDMLTRTVTRFVSSPFVLLMAINVVIFILGMFLPTSPVTVILGPVFVALGNSVGVNPIQMGIIMTMGAAIAFVSPPYGINLFIMASNQHEDALVIAKEAVPYVVVSLLCLILVTAFPAISLLLA